MHPPRPQRTAVFVDGVPWYPEGEGERSDGPRGESSWGMSSRRAEPPSSRVSRRAMHPAEASDDGAEEGEGEGQGGEGEQQQQPLLQSAAALHGSRHRGDLEAAGARGTRLPASQMRRKGRNRPNGHGKLSPFVALVFIFVVASVLALAGVVLSFPPVTSPDGDSGPRPAGPSPDNAPVVHSHEVVPRVARLRDSSEYVLSPHWDFDAPSTTREYHWTIVDANLNPDGVFRPMVLINNQFPGPLVECNEGDTLIVNIENRAVNSTSIHFHGLYQNGTNSMDGSVGITQCPIAPNSDFTYKFDVRGQSGTYWYHAHHSAQASDGLVGPVVIHSKDELEVQELRYATDRVVMVQDHYHNTTAELLMDYLQPDKENDEPVPDNALINGRGVRSCGDFPGFRCDSSSASKPVLDLSAGERHRLRFINVGAFAEFQIQIDEHPFYITEVDGTDVHPELFHRLNILPAQRYSIVVETNVTTGDAFWLRARMVSHCFTADNDRLEPELRGIVRYVSADTTTQAGEPKSRDWADSVEVTCRDLNTTALHPVKHMTPPPADDFVALRANFMIGSWRLSRGFFNDSTWHVNTTHPSLHRFLDAAPDAQTLGVPLSINDRIFARDTELVLQTTGIRTVDVSINNFDDGAHPFHLHGHKFFVVAQARSGYPPAAHEWPAYLEAHGGLPDNPLRRDTVTVEPYAWVVIRVVLDNAGLWALHCHNAWHADAGMVMQVLVRGDVVGDWRVGAEQRAMCERRGVDRGSRPDDGIWFGSF